MKHLNETDTNPAILYNYAKSPAKDSGTYNPTVNVDVDRDEEQEEDFLKGLSDLICSDESEELDLESSDELPKDNPYKNSLKDSDPDLADKLNKEAEKLADKITKQSEKVESTLDLLCDKSKTLEESFKYLGL